MSALSIATFAAARGALAGTPRVLALAGQRRGFIRVIQQGHEGWRLLLGSSPVKVQPGLRLSLPVLHTTQVVDMREVSQPVDSVTAFTLDNVPVTVTGNLFHQVKDSYKACFAVGDYQENIRNIGVSALRASLGTFTYDEIISDRARLNKKLTAGLDSDLQGWGISCTKAEISSFGPANEQVGRQLEMQMEAERHRRKQVLDTQAAVNVAGGQKEQSVLISQGQAAATVNQAEAERKAAVLRAQAMGEQVEILAKALASGEGNNVNPNEQHRKRALDALLEIQRLQQLNAIAQSSSKSTYFFGDAAMGTVPASPFIVDALEKLKK